MRSRAFACFAMLGAALGCGRSKGDLQADTLSVPVIAVAPESLDSLPEWKLDSAVLQIGAEDAGPDYLLENPGPPRQFARGVIIVPNKQSELRFYDSAGAFIRVVGRKGRGPGEYQQLWGIRQFAGDSILVYDFLGRLSVLDARGNLGRTRQTEQLSWGMVLLPTGGAVFLATDPGTGAMTQRRSGSGVFQEHAWLVRLHADGTTRDTLDYLPDGWWQHVGDNYTGVKLAEGAIIAADSLATVAAHGETFALRWYGPDGKLARLTRVDEAPRPVTDADLARADSADEARAQAFMRRRRIRREAGPAPSVFKEHAANLPMITRMRFDATGCLWVQRWVREGPVAEWIVFTAAGNPRARIRVPVAFNAHELGSDYVLGVFRDTDENAFVRRYGLRRDSAGALCR